MITRIAQVEETHDVISGLSLVQPSRGHRLSLDALLLAHFASQSTARGPVVDLGTGTGVIPLLLVARYGRSPVTGLEVQRRLFELAQRNVRLNGLEGDISLVLGDLREVRRKMPRDAFALATANPPYYGPFSASPEPSRAMARSEIGCTVDDVAAAAAHLLVPRGRLCLVFPASRLSRLFAALKQSRLEPRRLLLVYPRRHQKASRVLVEAVKGAREGLEVQPPLFVHEPSGRTFTEEVAALIR